MKVFRIISKLDIKDLYLVNSRLLEGLRVLGNPQDFIKFYYDQGIDEFILHDVTASYIGRNTLYDKLKTITKGTFLPLTLGGGIRKIDDVEKILNCGADKIFFNTSIVDNPKFVEEAVRIYGSSTIAANIVISKNDNNYILLKNHGRDFKDKNPLDWIKFLESIGVGEIILTFAHKEGTKSGFDFEFLNSIKSNISVPFIINGGADSADSIIEISKYSFVSGVAISTIFHEMYKINSFEKKVSKNLESRFDNLNKTQYKSGRKFTNIIKHIKKKLLQNKVFVRR